MMEVLLMLNTISHEIKSKVTIPDWFDGANADTSEDDEPQVANPPHDYDLLTAFEKTIGKASSTCECCGDVVDGHNLEEFIIGEIDTIDFSQENHVLLCRDCYNTKDWERIIQEQRRNQRINSPIDKAAHWITRLPAETLFLRRAAAGIVLLLAATFITTIMFALESGLGALWKLLASTNFAIVGGIALLGIVAGYWLHLHEREQNDHRGTTIKEYNLSDGPWAILSITTAALVIGTGIMLLSPNGTLSLLGLCGYLGSAVFAFKTLETAVRADRCYPRVNWIPRYDRELFAMRVSIVVGLAFLLGNITIGALTPALAIGTYLFARKWYDLGPNWKLLRNRSTGGDD